MTVGSGYEPPAAAASLPAPCIALLHGAVMDATAPGGTALGAGGRAAHPRSAPPSRLGHLPL